MSTYSGEDQIIQSRRRVREYEKRLDVSETMIPVSMGSLRLRRIDHG